MMMNHEELAGLEETLAVLSDPDLMRQIRQSEVAVAEGDVVLVDDLRGRLGSDPRA